MWEGSLGPDFFEEALYERFPVESKSDFTEEAPPRGYDEWKEEWPKCMRGVGAKSDQQVNIYSFAVRCRRMWSSTK